MSAVRLVLLGTTAPLAYAALEQVFSIAKGILWPGERGLRCALDSDGYRAEVSCVALHDAGEPSFAARVREADAVLFVADASEHRGARLARLAAEVQRHRAGVESRLHAGACVDQGPERSLRDVLVTAALLPAAWLDGLPKAQAVEGGHEVHETARALVGAVLRARGAPRGAFGDPSWHRTYAVDLLRWRTANGRGYVPARVAADGAGLVVYSKGKIGRCAPPFSDAFAGRSMGYESPPVESPFVRWSGGLAALTTKGTMALVAPLASQAPQYVFIAHYWQFRSLAAAGRAFLVATSACLHAFELLGDLDDEGPRVEPLWRLPSEHPEMRSHGQGAQRAYTQALWLAPGLALFGTEALGWFTYDGSEVCRIDFPWGRAVHGVGHSFETGSALFAAVHEGVCVCDPKTLRASHVVPWPCDLVSLPRQRFRPDTIDAVYAFSPSGDRVFVAHPYRGAMVLDARTGALHATTVFTDAIDGVDSVDWIDERTVALHTPTALYAIDVDALP